MNKKSAKCARVPRGTQGHVAEPRGPAQCLRGAFYIYIVYLYIIYNRGFQLSVDRKGIQPLNPSGIINPTDRTNFFRVGLKSHVVF